MKDRKEPVYVVVCGEAGELRTHHFDSAADGGKTVVSRLLLVCRGCHGNLHAGATHLRMDAREGLITLDRHGKPLTREGGAAAVLCDAGEAYPLDVLRKVAAEDSATRDVSAPPGDSRESCPLPPAVLPALSTFESLDDLPAEVTAREWRSLAGRLEWSASRRSFLLRSECEGMWFAQNNSCEPTPEKEMASHKELRKAGQLTVSFRPGALDNFIGQRRTVENLKLAIGAARARGETLGHLLLSGPPGLGKTTLARLAALELGAGFHPAVGVHLEEPNQLMALLAGLGPGDVLFIDELHGLRKPCQECLYGALEDGVLDVTIAEDASTRALRIRLEPFTLIGATSELGALAEPFRSRFALEERLEFYPEEDLARVVGQSAPELKGRARSPGRRGHCAAGARDAARGPAAPPPFARRLPGRAGGSA